MMTRVNYINNWCWGAINWTVVSQYSDKFCIMATQSKLTPPSLLYGPFVIILDKYPMGMSDTMVSYYTM